jgi:hypothetical protein
MSKSPVSGSGRRGTGAWPRQGGFASAAWEAGFGEVGIVEVGIWVVGDSSSAVTGNGGVTGLLGSAGVTWPAGRFGCSESVTAAHPPQPTFEGNPSMLVAARAVRAGGKVPDNRRVP